MAIKTKLDSRVDRNRFKGVSRVFCAVVAEFWAFEYCAQFSSISILVLLQL